MDGYALCCHAEDLNNQKFQVTGERFAPEAKVMTFLVKVKQFVYITGGKIPEGTTHVARQEIVALFRLKEICLTEHIRPKADIRFTGEEIQNRAVACPSWTSF